MLEKQNCKKGIFLMFLHCFFMSISTVFLKYLQDFYHITQIVFQYNILIYFSVLLLCFFSKKDLFIISTNNIKYHFLRSVFGFIGFLLFFYSISNINITDARAIIALDPIITSVLAIFVFKESVTFVKIFAFTITFCGAMILLHPSNMNFSIGTCSALLASLCFGIFNNITKRLSSDKNINQIFYSSLFYSIYTLLPAFIFWKDFLCMQHILVFLLLSLNFILSSLCVLQAFRKLEISLLMPVHFTGIIVTAILSFLVFGEKISFLTILGASIIMFGTMILFIK